MSYHSAHKPLTLHSSSPRKEGLGWTPRALFSQGARFSTLAPSQEVLIRRPIYNQTRLTKSFIYTIMFIYLFIYLLVYNGVFNNTDYIAWHLKVKNKLETSSHESIIHVPY